MKYDIGRIKLSPLFIDISDDELRSLLLCLSPDIAVFEKGGIVLHYGSDARKIGVVLSGQIRIIKEDYYGNRCIIADIGPGNLFAEAFAFSGVKALPVSAEAAADSEVLFIDSRVLISPCEKICFFHRQLIYNLLSIASNKNIALTQKIEHTSKRSTREKLLSYLSAEAENSGSGSFKIPFNRQELADYLGVDRSAMSAELGKLRDEGLLTFNKNTFELTGER